MSPTQEARAMDDRLRQHVPMVRTLARRLLRRLPASVQFDDIYQAGMIGLMDAVARFEEVRAAPFEAFARPRIRGAMFDELRKNDSLSRHMRRSQRTAQVAKSSVEQRLGQPSTEAGIACEMGITIAAYQELLREVCASRVSSVEWDGNDNDDTPWLEQDSLETCHAHDPVEHISGKRLRAELVRQIDQLPAREKLVLDMYYDDESTFREIGAVMGVSEARAWQLHEQAVKRLRSMNAPPRFSSQ